MSKRIIGALFVIAAAVALLALLCGVTISAQTASADGFSVETLAIAKQPVSFTTTYGEEGKALVVELNADVQAEYIWYVRKASSDISAVRYSSGKSASSEIRLPLTRVDQSGYYYCKVVAVTHAGARYVVSLTSEQAQVTIRPREAEVNLGKTEFTYNGAWQKPSATVKAEDVLSGDSVTAYVEMYSELGAQIASVDVGTYEAVVKLSNANYVVKGSDVATVTITPATLKIYVKEVAVRAGIRYDLELVYDGFCGDDDESVLSFTPTIPNRYYDVTDAGIYNVICTGLASDGNYAIVYPATKLYVNEKELTADKIVGAEATAGGSFKANTTLQLTESEEGIPGFSVFKFVRRNYELHFTAGGADGDTYTLNLADDKLVRFCLAACYVDGEGKAHALKGVSLRDGVLSVTIPTDAEDPRVVVYYDYTLVILIGAFTLLVLFIMILAIAASKRKFRRACYYYQTARDIADEKRREMQHYDD